MPKLTHDELDRYLRGRPHSSGSQELLDQELVRQARRLAAQGCDPAEIANRMGCHLGLVRSWLEIAEDRGE